MVILAAAFGLHHELGRESGVPFWQLPDEYEHFRASIKGYPIIIGRKSFDVIVNPLEGSLNIVVTHQTDYDAHGALVAHSVEAAIEEARKAHKEKIYIIGGGGIFKRAIDLADRLEVSLIDSVFEGATAFFPEFSDKDWKLVDTQHHDKDEKHALSFDFQVWERRK